MKLERYPLAWPAGRPRTPLPKWSPFKRQHNNGGGRHSMNEVMEFIASEVRQLGGIALVVSSNIKLRQDGLPYSGQAQPQDRGAAVYFTLKGKPVVFSCDKWDRVECNIYAIAMTVSATRGIERWGSATQLQSFSGFMALPEKATGPDPYEVLGLRPGCTEDDLRDAYRCAAKKFHPDVPETGSYAKWQQIQDAHNMIAQNVRGGA